MVQKAKSDAKKANIKNPVISKTIPNTKIIFPKNFNVDLFDFI